MRTFIFIKNIRNEHNQLERVIVGMTQSNLYPSNMRIEGSEYYGCDCVEVTEHCHVKLGVKY